MYRLQKLRAEQEFGKIDFYIIYKGYKGDKIKIIKRNRTASIRKYEILDEQCRAFEDELDLPSRLLPGTPAYEQAQKELAMREYQRAVDELERLVVQRMFELTKLGLSGVGEYWDLAWIHV